MLRQRVEGRCKLGGTQWFRGQLMPQFESEIPGPLRHNLPGFLSPGRVTTPAIRLLLDVFILQSGFKSATVQVEGDHIGGGEGTLGQIGQEEFIDDSGTSESNLPFLFLLRWSRMGCHNDAYQRSTCAQALVWTVVERAADPTFGTSEVLC